MVQFGAKATSAALTGSSGPLTNTMTSTGMNTMSRVSSVNFPEISHILIVLMYLSILMVMNCHWKTSVSVSTLAIFCQEKKEYFLDTHV